MAFCVKCGEELDADDLFCSNCGAKNKKKGVDKESKESQPTKSQNKKGSSNLIAAKCPSCGASISVDEDATRVKCEYCHTSILVDDAIERLKIELSGNVEVDNLPKMNDLLKVADLKFNNEEYDDALKYYDAALLLNPENLYMSYRISICKIFLGNYTKKGLNSFFSSLQDYLAICEVNKQKQVILEATKYLVSFNTAIISMHDKIKTPSFQNVSDYFERLESVNQIYEYILKNSDDSKVQAGCYYNIIFNTYELVCKRYYYTGRYNKNGVPLYTNFFHDVSLNESRIAHAKEYIEIYKKYDLETANLFYNKFASLGGTFFNDTTILLLSIFGHIIIAIIIAMIIILLFI